VYKKYDNKSVLRDISINLNKGEILGIIGPSGSGKSTLLRCISSLEEATEGSILLDNKKVNFGEIGIVFQELNLWPHKNAMDNITEALIHAKGMGKKEARKKAEQLLEKFDLLDKKDSYPANLSGGEKQRVAIARALATNPRTLLLDEITSALDPELVYELLRYIRSLADNGMSMIIVSHNMEFIRQLTDKVVFLENGILLEEGKPDKLFNEPINIRTKKFIEKISLQLNSQERSKDILAF
jgi:polar amino acid transport system ATP-binding protein